MSSPSLAYRDRAAQAHQEAEAATLNNVRDRALRAEAAWTQMAERAERVDAARAEREAPRTGSSD